MISMDTTCRFFIFFWLSEWHVLLEQFFYCDMPVPDTHECNLLELKRNRSSFDRLLERWDWIFIGLQSARTERWQTCEWAPHMHWIGLMLGIWFIQNKDALIVMSLHIRCIDFSLRWFNRGSMKKLYCILAFFLIFFFLNGKGESCSN
jgi:hypothetical protein